MASDTDDRLYNSTFLKSGISGSTLKWIAIVTMVIDHTAAVVVKRVLLLANGCTYDSLLLAYTIMRGIGRIAFPLFCFLLVEGFFHTHSRKKYALRLLLFALVSEVPFDLALKGKAIELTHQNVFFTLFIGLFVISLMNRFKDRFEYQAIAAAIGMAAAYMIRCDYDWVGILLIVVLYLLHGNRRWQCAAGAAVVCYELPAPLAFLPILFYNGKRGRRLKYFFYIFYPAHLLLLYFVSLVFVSGFSR